MPFYDVWTKDVDVKKCLSDKFFYTLITFVSTVKNMKETGRGRILPKLRPDEMGMRISVPPHL